MKNRFEQLDVERKQVNHKPDYKNRNVCSDNQRLISKSDDDEAEPVNSIHVSLTRQSSDPSKKIKRTPAFRKEKFLNSRSRTSMELSFASKVSLFESNDVCDKKVPVKLSSSPKQTPELKINQSTLHKTKKEEKVQNNGIKTRIIGRNVVDFDKNGIIKAKSLSPERKQLSLRNRSSSETKRQNVNLKDRNLKNATTKNRVNVENKRNNLFDNLNETLKQEFAKTKSSTISTSLKNDSTSNIKVRSKQSNAQSDFAQTRAIGASFLKEMLDNKTNNDFEKKISEENLEVKKIPEYAEVKKPKKDHAMESLTDTLKAALKQPLPVGPPPKKPPRTFAHVPQGSPGISETNIIHKHDKVKISFTC